MENYLLDSILQSLLLHKTVTIKLLSQCYMSQSKKQIKELKFPCILPGMTIKFDGKTTYLELFVKAKYKGKLNLKTCKNKFLSHKHKCISKKSHTSEGVGAQLTIYFWDLLMNLKNNY